MTQPQRSLADGGVEEDADGWVTRREAVRRLGLLGVGTGAAAVMLAGPPATAASAGEGRPWAASAETLDTAWGPVPTQAVAFDGPRGRLLAAWAPAPSPRGGLLVVHENRGLNDHIRSVAGRFAATGWSSLAIDLLSEEGGTDALPDDAARAAALAAAAPERFVEDMDAAITQLVHRVAGRQVAALGFGFGGALVWRLLTSGDQRLAAAAPFYGPFPRGGSLKGTKAAVLAVYGGLDARVNATRDEARSALEAIGRQHEVLTFGGADHAFFNDTGARYDVAAAAEANRRVAEWLDRHVGPRGS